MSETVEGQFSADWFFKTIWKDLLGGGACVAFGVALFFVPWDPKEDPRWGFYLQGAFFSAGLIFGAVIVLEYWRSARRLTVTPTGVSWILKGREGSAQWTDLREFYREETFEVTPAEAMAQQRSDWNRTASVRLVFHDGTKVTFLQALTNYDALAEAMQRYATEAVLAQKVAEMSDRGEAEFGRFVVSSVGLRVKNKLRPWSEINYAVSNGCLCLVHNRDDFTAGVRKEFELRTMPNYLVLLILMQQFGKPPIDP